MLGDTIQKFLDRYGGLEFTKVKFRPGQAFTTDFGFDNTFGNLRIHTAVDRGNKGSDPNMNLIYAPFDCFATWIPETYNGFGSLLILYTSYGFEIRIAHMEDVAPIIKNNNALIPAGTILGSAGSKGKSTGIHTHTEIVSLETTNTLLDRILYMKYGDEVNNFFTVEDAITYIRTHNVEKDMQNPEGAWTREIQVRGIRKLNNFLCVRDDYADKKIKTFYSSKKLFGM